MTLLVVVAHPDDETFGCGSVIARAVAEGERVVVCCATRGELGEPRPGSVPDGVDLATVREQELREAAALLGVASVEVLDFRDSGWDGPCDAAQLCGAPISDVVAGVSRVLDAHRPDVVVTLDPSGGDGHRDHVRIAQATTAAFDAVARAGARLYYWCLVRSVMHRWVAHHEGSVYDGQLGYPDEQVTTAVDVTELLDLRLRAIACHASQASPYDGLPVDLRNDFLCVDRLVRARPPWTGGPVETRLSSAGAPPH